MDDDKAFVAQGCNCNATVVGSMHTQGIQLLFIHIFISWPDLVPYIKAISRRWVLPLTTQGLENFVGKLKRSVLTLGSLCLRIYAYSNMRYTASSWSRLAHEIAFIIEMLQMRSYWNRHGTGYQSKRVLTRSHPLPMWRNWNIGFPRSYWNWCRGISTFLVKSSLISILLDN